MRSFLVVFVAACAVLGEAATGGRHVPSEAAAGAKAADNVYDSFLFLRLDGTIVLVNVGEDGLERAELWRNKSLEYGWEPLLAARGKLYGIRRVANQLLEIDLVSGQCGIVTSSLAPYYRHPQSGRIYCTMKLANGYRLVVYDLERGIWRDIMESPFREEAACFTHIAVSLDERLVAFPEALAEDVEGFSKAEDMVLADSNGRRSGLSGSFSSIPLFRLVFADLESGRITRLPWEFAYAPSCGDSATDAFPTGRGISIRWHQNQIAWYDSRTVLVVRSDYPRDGRPRVGLAAFDIETGGIEDVAVLPMIPSLSLRGSITQLGDKDVRLVGDVSFWPGTYRVDLKGGPLIEESKPGGIGGAFSWEGGKLLWGGKAIEGSEGASSVVVSPDGRRIVWRRSPSRKGKDRNDVLCWDSVKGGEPVVAAKDARHTVGFMWVGNSEMSKTEIPEPPMPWHRIEATPWESKPQPRVTRGRAKSEVTDLLSMELRTDKNIYKQHEQVMVTVILKNISDHDLEVNEHGPAFDIWLKTSRSRRLMSQFDHRLFNSNPVVIKAGESIERTRAIEIYRLGSHWFSGGLCLGRYKWKGQLSARSPTFEVTQSADAEELLKAKFYRLIAPCKDPNTKHTHQCRDVVRLGPSAAKYLIAELESTEDPDFHKKMSSVFTAWADPNSLPYVDDRLREDLHKKMIESMVKLVSPKSLPYLKSWLEGNMRRDRKMVMHTLAKLCRNPATKEQATILLLDALDHREAGVRHDAAAVLTDVSDPRVPPALNAMLDDEDAKVAALAARHFAACEGLSLAEWFALTAKEPTQARYIAARSIIAELQEQWQISRGKLPALSWEQCDKSPAALKQFKQTVRDWEKWARKNPNFSSRYFNKEP